MTELNAQPPNAIPATIAAILANCSISPAVIAIPPAKCFPFYGGFPQPQGALIAYNRLSIPRCSLLLFFLSISGAACALGRDGERVVTPSSRKFRLRCCLGHQPVPLRVRPEQQHPSQPRRS